MSLPGPKNAIVSIIFGQITDDKCMNSTTSPNLPQDGLSYLRLLLEEGVESRSLPTRSRA